MVIEQTGVFCFFQISLITPFTWGWDLCWYKLWIHKFKLISTIPFTFKVILMDWAFEFQNQGWKTCHVNYFKPNLMNSSKIQMTRREDRWSDEIHCRGIDGDITSYYIMRSTCDSCFIQLHDHPYTTQTFSVCLMYVSIHFPLSLFLHLVKSSLFILELLLCFKRAQRIEEAVAVKVLCLSQLRIPPWGQAMLSPI